ncbi:ion channel DMI1-like isoform X2 [Salvia miltiorrhiza]|uniref:ion channel DMI1-like isoform X2 n=1 Tax=Salvia miltiorrhiza TaxID=226208 RepID=UPI0025AC919D|nr:ion channel DMI1-like isoform X2 [Salvia miltiorrhiza]
MKEGNSGQSSPAKPERPPLSKKSRTTSSNSDDSQTPHFPGPLFRRISQTPPSSCSAASSTATATSSSASTSSSSEAFSFNFSDRDYVFPSNLGGYSTRRNVSVKSSSSFPKSQPPPPQLSARSASMPPSLSSGGGGGLTSPLNKLRLRADKDLKALSLQASLGLVSAPAVASVSGNHDTVIQKSSSFNNSWRVYLLKFFCFTSATFAIFLRNEVSRLKDEYANLQRFCSNENPDHNKHLEVSVENGSSFLSSVNSDPRAIALYTVIVTLVTPLLLYEYLDYLPRIRSLSKWTKDCKEEVPLKKRIAYMVDVCFSVYPYAKLLALLFATLFLIGFGGLALYAVSDSSFAEALWLSWTFVADSGNHADRVGTGPRIVSVSISSGGMLIFAMMLGLVSDAISEKVDSLRKGKSEVIESNHILILGWSDKLGSLLKQLAIANKSIGGGVIVVLAERDKEEMEMDIAKLEFDLMGTSVICRSGSPLILADLKKIWEDILGFENAEFYIKRWPELDGCCYEEVLISFPDAIPCGVKVHADGGKIKMNPDDRYVLREGDEILVIAEDDDTYAPGPIPKIRRGVYPRTTDPPKFPEKILFCGWRRDIDDMIMVLEALLSQGSELWMFNEVPEKDREKKLTEGGLDISGLVNLKLVHREGNAVIRRHLESLPLETFDSILILADESMEDSIVHSDSRSLATLLLIRDIQSKRLPYTKSSSPLSHSGFSQSSWIQEMQQASDKSIIISEILDSRTRNLVSVTRISDYVLSNELVSMALAMVAEDKQINRVLEELFAEEGNEMCIKPAEFYLYDQEELCFYEIMIRGRQRQEIVIGYRLAAAEQAVINPANKLTPCKWSIDDIFVVISKGG